MSQLTLILGSMGSGKTHVCSQLLGRTKTPVALISPTYWTNANLWTDYLGIQPDDVFVNLAQAPAALDEVVRRIKMEHKAYKANEEHVEAYEAHRQGRPLSIQQQALLEQHGAPKTKVELIRPCVVLDDLQASRLMSSKSFQSLVLRMRHVCASPQVGLSFYILSQSLKNGALPRALRCCVGLWIVFPTRDQSVIRNIWTEVSGRVTWDEFKSMFMHCTSGDDRPYLVIDLTQGGNPKKTFKRTLQGEWLDPSAFA